MEQFGEIEFQEVTATKGVGTYDGREFILLYSDDTYSVDGEFTDEERLFIFTQWELAQ